MVTPRRLITSLVVLTSVVLVPGCRTHPSSLGETDHVETVPTLDLSEAKRSLLEDLDVIHGVIPESEGTITQREDTGALLSCSEDSWSWTSHGETTMHAEQDLVPWLYRISQVLEDKVGATVKEDKTGLGQPRLDVRTPEGHRILVDARADHVRIVTTAFSACVTDLADYSGETFY